MPVKQLPRPKKRTPDTSPLFRAHAPPGDRPAPLPPWCAPPLAPPWCAPGALRLSPVASAAPGAPPLTLSPPLRLVRSLVPARLPGAPPGDRPRALPVACAPPACARMRSPGAPPWCACARLPGAPARASGLSPGARPGAPPLAPPWCAAPVAFLSPGARLRGLVRLRSPVTLRASPGAPALPGARLASACAWCLVPALRSPSWCAPGARPAPPCARLPQRQACRLHGRAYATPDGWKVEEKTLDPTRGILKKNWGTPPGEYREKRANIFSPPHQGNFEKKIKEPHQGNIGETPTRGNIGETPTRGISREKLAIPHQGNIGKYWT